MPEYVSELQVLIATCRWLHENGWQIDSIAPATGFGLAPIGQQRETIVQEFSSAQIPFEVRTLFRQRGPDIIASSGTVIWKLECKGMATARTQTHRNNFDRAVASVVSYYDTPQARLGLALGGDYLWNYWLGDRLPVALRKALGLWVLLVENGKAYEYPPDEVLPYPGAND